MHSVKAHLKRREGGIKLSAAYIGTVDSFLRTTLEARLYSIYGKSDSRTSGFSNKKYFPIS